MTIKKRRVGLIGSVIKLVGCKGKLINNIQPQEIAMTNQKLKIILGVNLTKVCEIMCTFSCLLIYTKNLKIR